MQNGKGDRNRSDPEKYAEGWDYIFNRFSHHDVAFADGSYVVSRPKGGHLWHARVKGDWTALCGYTPSAPRAFLMKDRSGWMLRTDKVSKQDVTCDGCKRKLGMVQ